jgi:hypothetical protein
MGIDEDLEDAPTDSSTTSKRSKLLEKRKVTVEDSMEVISELISEIQSSEMLPSIQTVSSQDYPKPPIKQTERLRISLARKSKSGVSSLSFLPLLRKFFHALLTSGATAILPVRNDSKATPLKLTSQINELTAVGAKTFLKASRPNGGNIAGDFHISTSLSFEELSNHPNIINWMTLYVFRLNFMQ